MRATCVIVRFGALAMVLALFGAGCESTQAPCAIGELACDGACTDLSSDHEHCGSCSVACAAGQVCFDGACAADCGGGTTKCGDRCFDTEIDPRNCGACGVVCPSTNVCSHGACATSCDAEQTICAGKDGNYCRDLFSDNLNCGACGLTCDAETVCAQGICASTCIDKQTLCTPTTARAYCAYTATDSANCGSCGNVCDLTLACLDSVCSPICGIGQSACFPPPNATPFCTDTHYDPNNCGSCGTVCGNDAVCSNSECQCLDTKKWCGACVDTQSDPNNCGSCQTVCASGTCSRGMCVIDIATNAGLDSLVADDVDVYFTVSGVLKSVANGGGPVTQITSGFTPLNMTLLGLVQDATTLYFVDTSFGASRLCSVLKSGGAVSILASVSDTVTNVAIDGVNVYARGANGIYSAPIGGGAVTTLGIGDGILWFVPAIASDGSSLYWLTAPGIVSTPVGGGAVTTIYTGSPANLLNVGTKLYFLSQDALFSMTPPAAANVIALNITSVAISNFIYGSDGVTIWSIDPKNTSIVVPIVDGNIAVNRLAASSTYVTWSDGNTLHQVHL